jgi:hypothetical protein
MTRSTEVRQVVHRYVTETVRLDVVGNAAHSSSSHGLFAAGSGGFTGRSGSMQHAERTGAAGEVFLFSWLSQQLPGFTHANWCSGNRVHLPKGQQQLQPPDREPSFDFMYEDTDGVLSGEPGTLCYIECKATASDLRSSSSSLVPMPITPAEWSLAQQVHRERLAGRQVQYILIRVDRVGKPGGPRVVAVLHDPVQLLGEGVVRITGDNLCINSYPLLAQ